MQATLHGNSPCHSSFLSSYFSLAYNFLLCSEGLGKLGRGGPPPPFAVTVCLCCSLLLLLQLSKWYLSALWRLLCTLSEDPDPSLGLSSGNHSQDWIQGFHEQLS